MSTSLGDPAVASPSGPAETDAPGTLHPPTSVADRAATPGGAVTTPRPGSPALAGWVRTLRHPQPEDLWSRASARLGGLVSVLAILAYLTWRVASTLPAGTAARAAAYTLIAFEGLPILALLIRIVTLWNIDCRAPEPVSSRRTRTRVAVLIPT